ncbi:ABC transporter substrate-binding protein [Kurthia massiliensis]|uniref:ABC transporter substrate-binding protein n=1 Tax=Kurthia massiliensis TaxID=1033739 RepID=UPI000287BD9D|nr:ABC transporter substrate-binding protein [Kurthia massiliensis]
MKKYWKMGAAALFALSLAACGTSEESSKTDDTKTEASSSASEEAKELTINYLGTDYTFDAPVKNIVTASMESMEDAVALGIKPVGVLEVGGEIPEYLQEGLEGAELIGNKMAPNNEKILSLDPDAIIGTDKWAEDVMSKMNKMATTLPYSHFSDKWKDNLNALATLSGTEDKAKEIIDQYESDVADLKSEIQASDVKDKSVLMIRIRGGQMFVYPESVYFNPILYTELGLKAPDVVTKAEAQAQISLETLSDVDPDYIFLEFDESENAEAKTALDDVQKDAVFKALTAAKADHVFVNEIAPLAEGGTAWSKTRFLDVVENTLLK